MPLNVKAVPLALEGARNTIERFYLPGRMPKALALSPRGNIGTFFNQSSHEEATRRALEFCGLNAGVPCAIVAVDNMFIVPIPMTMKVTGFFRPANLPDLTSDRRENIARILTEGGNGWSAVARGADSRVGVAVKAANEADATMRAVADCGGTGQQCRVIAIGMFMVEPN